MTSLICSAWERLHWVRRSRITSEKRKENESMIAGANRVSPHLQSVRPCLASDFGIFGLSTIQFLEHQVRCLTQGKNRVFFVEFAESMGDCGTLFSIELRQSSDNFGGAHSGKLGKSAGKDNSASPERCHRGANQILEVCQSQRDCVPKPGVARHELPWALLRNPVGIQGKDNLLKLHLRPCRHRDSLSSFDVTFG